MTLILYVSFSQQPSFCKSDQLYSISFELLRGVCSTLENAGFNVIDEDGALSFLSTGLNRDAQDTRRKTPKPSTKRKPLTPASTTLLLRRPEIGSSVVSFGDAEDLFSHPGAQPLPVGGSVVPVQRSYDDHNDEDNEVEDQPRVTLLPTHVNAFSPSLISVNGSVTFLSFLNG